LRDEQKYVFSIFVVKILNSKTLIQKLDDKTIIENMELIKIEDKMEDEKKELICKEKNDEKVEINSENLSKTGYSRIVKKHIQTYTCAFALDYDHDYCHTDCQIINQTSCFS